MFKVLQWNCRSLRNKDPYLSLLVNIHRPSVICLQETRLDDQPDPSVLKHYHPYKRYDGHGVAIYTHKTLTQTEVTLNTPLEAVACRVKFNDAYLAICSLYLPHNTSISDDDITSLISQLPGNRLILGDFNAHHQQWGSERSSPRGEQIVNLLLQTNLCLLNDGSATRVDDRTGTATAIDLSVASANIFPDFSWEVIDDSHGSDHLPICISHARDTPSTPRSPKFNFKRADWASFRAIADVDVSGEDIDTKVSNATHSILHAAEVCIPKTATVHTKRGVTWWTTDCRQALRERNRRYRYFSQQPSQDNFIAYKKARAQARKVILNAKRNSFRQFVTTVNRTTPLTQVWKTITILSNKKQFNPLNSLKINGNVIDDPRAIANTIAHHFHEASSTASYDPAFLPRKEAAEHTVPNFAMGGVNSDYNSEFTLDELLLALKTCKGSSPGPDNITYSMLQHLGPESLKKILKLYNEIWTTHTFPRMWHFSHIIPIPKKTGRLTDPSAFRPIALTSCLCKVMERMIKRRLLFVLEARGLLSVEQSGFRKHRSTMDHLTNLEHCISEAFANKHFMVGVFLDIHKAFDMTWRHGILMKLHAHGFRGNLPIFVYNFLQDRTFSVKLPSNVFSDIFVQENGVPQGSVLSPILFSIMINDILSTTPAPRNLKYSFYADDWGIWHSSPYAEFSAGRIQLALDSFQHWASLWGFKFSVPKCIGVVFTRRKIPNLHITLHGQPIPFQNSVKFLGLHFDSRLIICLFGVVKKITS